MFPERAQCLRQSRLQVFQRRKDPIRQRLTQLAKDLLWPDRVQGCRRARPEVGIQQATEPVHCDGCSQCPPRCPPARSRKRTGLPPRTPPIRRNRRWVRRPPRPGPLSARRRQTTRAIQRLLPRVPRGRTPRGHQRRRSHVFKPKRPSSHASTCAYPFTCWRKGFSTPPARTGSARRWRRRPVLGVARRRCRCHQTPWTRLVVNGPALAQLLPGLLQRSDLALLQGLLQISPRLWRHLAFRPRMARLGQERCQPTSAIPSPPTGQLGAAVAQHRCTPRDRAHLLAFEQPQEAHAICRASASLLLFQGV